MAANTAQQQSPQAAYLTPEQFLQLSKPKTVKVQSAISYVDGGTTVTRMPQSGLLSCLYVSIQGSIVIGGTVTSGTYKSYPIPAPYSLIRRVRFGSNNAFQIRDLNGWSWYKWVRYRYGYDLNNVTFSVGFSANTSAALGVTGNGITPGGNISAGTKQINIFLPLPVAYNNAGENGLIVLQQNSTYWDLTIDWGQVVGGIGATGGSNDIFVSFVGTSVTVSATITFIVGMDWFEPVMGIDRLVSMFMAVSDFAQSPLLAGDNIVKPPVNDYYTFLLLEVVNAGAPLAVANLSNILLQHSGNVYDYMDDYLTKMGRSLMQHDLLPMDGCIDWDLGLRRGLIGRRDVFDAFNYNDVTDLQLRFTTPGSLSITGINQVSCVFESLRYIHQQV